jgi:hypothetical protein
MSIIDRVREAERTKADAAAFRKLNEEAMLNAQSMAAREEAARKGYDEGLAKLLDEMLVNHNNAPRVNGVVDPAMTNLINTNYKLGEKAELSKLNDAVLDRYIADQGAMESGYGLSQAMAQPTGNVNMYGDAASAPPYSLVNGKMQAPIQMQGWE